MIEKETTQRRGHKFIIFAHIFYGQHLKNVA